MLVTTYAHISNGYFPDQSRLADCPLIFTYWTLY